VYFGEIKDDRTAAMDAADERRAKGPRTTEGNQEPGGGR
jgi:hypothetical protein